MGATTLADPVATGSNKPPATVFGDRRIRYLGITMSNSYPTGGDTISLTPYFKGSVDFVDIEDANVDATHVYRAVYDRANNKIKVLNLIGGVEVVNAVDLSAVTFRAMVVGKS